MTSDTEILFEITDEALLVANGGKPFTRAGVISVCASHLSEKSEEIEVPKCRDKKLVDKITELELKTYKDNPNRLKSDYKIIKETSSDYHGRLILELLQNADDVMGTDRSNSALIGTKGLGFKSVLEITDEPEIHSGPFHFLFSAERTQQLLRKRKLKDPPPLIFRIPHQCKPNAEVKPLIQSGYATVMRLPFKNDAARQLTLDLLEELDAKFLLFLQALERVRVRVDGHTTVYAIDRCQADGLADGDVVLTSVDNEETRWRRWVNIAPAPSAQTKQSTTALCLPLNAAGKPMALQETTPLYVFFPTEETHSARGAIHISFDLEQNRKHTREGKYDDLQVDAFQKLLKRVIEEIDARTVLEVFGKVESEGESNKPMGKLCTTIRGVLESTAFIPVIGGELARPGEVKLWRDDLGEVVRDDVDAIKEEQLLAADLIDLSNILGEFGASSIGDEEYIRLLQYCRNSSRDKCLRSWYVMVLKGLKKVRTEQREQKEQKEQDLSALRQVPCWWTEADKPRALAGECLLLRSRNEGWPEWLPIEEVLHPAWLKAIKEIEGDENNDHDKDLWKEEFLPGKLLANDRKDFFDYALLPFITNWDENQWQSDGWKALKQVFLWSPLNLNHKFEDISPWVKGYRNKKTRDKAAETVYLPTVDGGWALASDCYAGADWDGPSKFDRYFEKTRIVLPFKRWSPATKKSTKEEGWKALLRWLGVSWEPKVLHKENWGLESFPQCIKGIKAEYVLKMMKPLMEPLVIVNSSSTAHAQLRKKRWLKCTSTMLHDDEYAAPREAYMYMPEFKRIKGFLPLVDARGITDAEWHGEIADMLKELGVQSELPKSLEGWHPWLRVFGKDTKPIKNKFGMASGLYHSYLKLEYDNESFPKDIRIPCLTGQGDQTVDFALAEQVYYVDKPYLDKVRIDIAKEGYKLFIFCLNDGKSAVERLGISNLSGQIEIEPEYKQAGQRECEALLARYKERRDGLALAIKHENLPEAESSFKVVSTLRLILKKSDSTRITTVDVNSWQQDDLILVNIAKGKWRALADALSEHIGKKDKRDLLENLLREKDESYKDRLRAEGVTKDAIEGIGESWDITSLVTESQDIMPKPVSDEPVSDAPVSNKTGTQQAVAVSDRSSVPATPRQTKPHSSPAPSAPRPYIPRAQHSTQNTRHQNQAKTPNPSTGLRAEDWLGTKLEAAFPGQVERHVRDDQNRESDFVIRYEDKTEFHIEVKHSKVSPFTFHWSDLQVEKARDIEKESTRHYFIALLSPGSDAEDYAIRWSWSPLLDMESAERTVEWSGKSGPESVTTWEVADLDPGSVETEHYSFTIKLTDETSTKLETDSDTLTSLKRQIDQLNGQHG